MTQPELILMAILAVFGLFALPALAAKDKGGKSSGGFNFLPALCAVCFSAAIGGAAFADSDLPHLPLVAWIGDISKMPPPETNRPVRIAPIDDLKDIPEIAPSRLPGNNRPTDSKPDIGKIILGWTSLHIAAEKGNVTEARRLIDEGKNIEAKNIADFTPLHIAAYNDKAKIALILVQAGANLRARTTDGNTPLDIAIRRYGKDSVIALFLQKAMKAGKTNEQQAEDLLRELE
ncbi:MAG: ankyrin repeat domain-containing protein [Gammaproteobacteria bacterium]